MRYNERLYLFRCIPHHHPASDEGRGSAPSENVFSYQLPFS